MAGRYSQLESGRGLFYVCVFLLRCPYNYFGNPAVPFRRTGGFAHYPLGKFALIGNYAFDYSAIKIKCQYRNQLYRLSTKYNLRVENIS